LLIHVEQPRKVYRTVHGKDLPGIELEDGAQAFDDLGIGVGFNLHANGIAFAAVVQLRSDGFEKIARLFFLQIEVAVTGDAEWSGRHNVIAVIHALGVMGDQIGKENEIRGVLRRQAHQARQSARHRDHTRISDGGASSPAQKQAETQRFIDHAGKGMRGIDRHRSEQRI